MSEKEMLCELLREAKIKEDGAARFTNRAKEIIKELAADYRQTEIYKKSEKVKPVWIKNATAKELYTFMCLKIVEAPTLAMIIAAAKILLPTLWDKIQEEERAGNGKEQRNTRSGDTVLQHDKESGKGSRTEESKETL